MKKRTNQRLQSVLPATIVIIFLLGASVSAFAQKTDYKPGDKIEYSWACMAHSSRVQTDWEEGTFVRPDENSPLYALITRASKDSGVMGFKLDCIRPLSAKKTPVDAEDEQKANAETKSGGTGLMTKEEIIGYMRANGYANGEPKRDPQVCKDLVEQIKRRGVKKRFEIGDDISTIGDNGCSPFVEQAAQDNIGTPTTIGWLSGTWLLVKIGGTVDTAPGDGYIHRQNESIAKTGFITINANSTYIWKVYPTDPPAKYIKGTWRKATSEEMNQQGGAGVVLQKGKDDADWIAYKYMLWKGDNIDIQHLQQRGRNRFIGSRK